MTQFIDYAIYTARSLSENVTRVYHTPFENRVYDSALDTESYETDETTHTLLTKSAVGTTLYAAILNDPNGRTISLHETPKAAADAANAFVDDTWEDDDGPMRERFLPAIEAVTEKFLADPTSLKSLNLGEWNSFEILPVLVSDTKPPIDDADERVISARSHLCMCATPSAAQFAFFLYPDRTDENALTKSVEVATYDAAAKTVNVNDEQLPLILARFPDVAMFERSANRLMTFA